MEPTIKDFSINLENIPNNCIKVTACLSIPKSTLPIESLESLRNELSFPNPFDNTDVFYGFQEDEEYITIPRGYPIGKVYCDLTVDSKAFYSLVDGFNLRDYQEAAEDSILGFLRTATVANSNILLTAKTGSGKSYMLSSVLQKLGLKAIFLSHLSMLSTQLHKELSANTTADVRILSSANMELGDINICTFQLLHSNRELLDVVANNCSVLVVDETENIASTSRLAVLYALCTKVNIFVSATPTRELVQRTGLIEKLVTHTVEMLQPEEHRVKLKYIMLDYRHLSWQSPMDPNHYKTSYGAFLNKHKILKDTAELCSALSERMGVIWIIATLEKTHKTLRECLEKLGIPVASIQGSTSKKSRSKILYDIQQGRLKVIISSAPMSAGISIPEISCGIRLEPHSSSDELLEQQEGRCVRYAPFKSHQDTLWIDFGFSGSLEFSGKKRFKHYQQTNGCKIWTKATLLGYIQETNNLKDTTCM